MTRLEAAAARLVASWTRAYTAGLPAPVRAAAGRKSAPTCTGSSRMPGPAANGQP